MSMKKNLPEAVKTRTPTEKLVWLYLDRYPGQHSVRSLHAALGVNADRALPGLVRDGLVIEEEAPAGSRLGKYRAVSPAAPAQGEAGG
jgi:hypothetical protein